MQHDFIRQLLCIGRIAFAPIVTDSVSEDIPGTIERGAGDRASDGGIALETMFGVLVPEVKGAVTAGGAEGAVLRMEGDGVDGVNVGDVAVIGGCFAMAFEAEIGAGIFVFDVLDGAAAFDAADGESSGVGEAADDPRLPLERGLDRFVEFGRVVEVDDVDVPVRRADY